VTLAALREGKLDPDDIRAISDTIRRQVAENLMRAAELAAVPAETIELSLALA
jgi:propanediol dehydratase small subunit